MDLYNTQLLVTTIFQKQCCLFLISAFLLHLGINYYIYYLILIVQVTKVCR